MKYRIVHNKVTNRYKVQSKFFWFWLDVFWDTVGKEEAESRMRYLILTDENQKKSNWKVQTNISGEINEKRN